MFAELDQYVFSLHKSLKFSPTQLERRNLSPKNTYLFLIFTALHASFHLRIWISQQEVLNFLWVPEGWNKLAFLKSVLFWTTLIFPLPTKISVPERTSSATPLLMQFCLISTRQLLKGAAEPHTPQQAFQFLSTSFPAGAIPDASSYPVIMHLTKVIDVSFFPFSNVSSPLVLFVCLAKASPGLDSCQISERTNTCISQTHLHAYRCNRYQVCICAEYSTFHFQTSRLHRSFSHQLLSFFLISLSPSLFPSLPSLIYFFLLFPEISTLGD